MKKVLITDAVHSSILKEVEKIGYEVDYRPKMPYGNLKFIISKYSGIIINSKIIINKEMIDLAKHLEFIGRLGSGLDIIDLDYARKKNINVYSAPEGNCNAVGEHALGMLLALANNLIVADREVKSYKWYREKNRGFELEGKKIGIIGFGHTGPAFARKLSGFDVEIFVHDKYKNEIDPEFHYVRLSTKKEIQENCDIISIHLPLTKETIHYVDEEFINECEKTPIIINTARGKNINTLHLVNALEEKTIRAACLDVLENEKLHTFNDQETVLFNKLIDMNNVILTPHIAGWTKESKKKIAETLILKIRSHSEDSAEGYK